MLTPLFCLQENTLSSFKSAADRLGVPTGVTGETCQGVVIGERTRVSDFRKDTDIEGIKELLNRRHEHYRRVNVPAVVFGLHQQDGSVLYALYAKYAVEG